MPLAMPADRTTMRRSCVPIFNEPPRVARDLWAYGKILPGDGLAPSPAGRGRGVRVRERGHNGGLIWDCFPCRGARGVGL